MTTFRQALLRLLLGSAFGLGLFGTASAGMVSTEDAIDSARIAETRTQLKALVQRPELAKELQALGANPTEAQARVDAMTDAEVRTLAGKLGVLPAGGALTNNELILILVLIIIALAL